MQIPKLRQGSYFPGFLEPRRRSEQALLAVVQQALCVRRFDRRVDQLVESLGLWISRSEVSRVCAALDEHVEAFRGRPLEGRYPYLFLDAKVEKVRDGGRVVAKALVVAHGVEETGRRQAAVHYDDDEYFGMAVDSYSDWDTETWVTNGDVGESWWSEGGVLRGYGNTVNFQLVPGVTGWGGFVSISISFDWQGNLTTNGCTVTGARSDIKCDQEPGVSPISYRVHSSRFP